MGLWSNRRNLIGLDIGSSSVKAVRLRERSGGYTIDALWGVSFAAKSPSDAQYASTIVSAVGECLDHIPGGRDAVCAVKGECVMVRPFQFAPLLEREIPGAVRLEASQVCPFSMEKAAMAYQILSTTAAKKRSGPNGTPEKEPRISGLLAAATTDAVERTRTLVAQAGARCVLMDVDGLALLNGIRRLGTAASDRENGEKCVAVVHVGHSCTTVAIATEDTTPLIRDIPLAGRAIEEHIQKQTAPTAKRAQRRHIRHTPR